MNLDLYGNSIHHSRGFPAFLYQVETMGKRIYAI